MKQAMKGLFSILLLVSTAVQATNTVGRSFFLGGLGNGASNGLIQHAGRTNLFDAEGFYAVFSSHSEYSQNFDRSSIAEYLFFNGTSSMVVGPVATAAAGTSTSTTGKTDIFAVHLGLGESFDSTITASPKVRTFSGNLDLYIGLGDLWEGLYLDMNLPIVHTKWDMGLEETVRTSDTSIGDDVIDGDGAVTTTYTTAIGALKGDKVIGDLQVSTYNKVDGEQSITKVGNTKAVLGYNVINKENAHFGLGLLGVFNGNGATDAEYAFEPNVGTAGRHGLGGRVDGHMNLYEKDEHNLSAHMRADVFTTFKRTMRRTYDFTTNGVGSRYTLIKEFTAVGDNYAGKLYRAGNITSLQAKIAMNVVYEADFMLHYTNGNFIVDAGYGLRGHSKEEHKEWVDTIAGSKYGFWGYEADDGGNDPLAAAHDGNNAVDVLTNGFNVAGTAVNPFAAATSITEAALNKDSGLAKAAMSHQVYGNLGYTWADSEWNPMIAVGGGASFSGDDNNAFDLWTVHLSMGASF